MTPNTSMITFVDPALLKSLNCPLSESVMTALFDETFRELLAFRVETIGFDPTSAG